MPHRLCRLPRRSGLVLVLVVALLLTVVHSVAVDGDKGAACPSCVALDWADYMDSLWWDENGQTRVTKDVVPSRRAALLAQRQMYIAAMREDARRYPFMSGNAFDPFSALPATTVDGKAATVVLRVSVRWPSTDPHSGLWFYSDAYPWRFEVRQDRTGSRIWPVTMPDWCGTYSRCGSSGPTPSEASPSPTLGDPLAPLASMLPCGPKDPFRQWHTCPAS